VPSIRPHEATRVLIVDDDPQVRSILSDVFQLTGYIPRVAENGREGLERFKAERFPLILTDIKMPIMDGIEFFANVRALDPDTAVIILTGVGEMKTAIETLKAGASDFIMKPVNLDELVIAAERALERRRLILENRDYQRHLERRVEESTRQLSQAFQELQQTYRTTLEALGSALDTRDIETQAHSHRVWGYAVLLTRDLGVKGQELTNIEHGVLLHDIGKIGIPDRILLKPGPLTEEEWREMKRHPEIGRRLLSRIKFLEGAIPTVYHHHERYDGSGYPVGLKGEEIPLGARIFSVVDAFDAMTFDRPYSKAIPLDSAFTEIKRCIGTHFDPKVAEAFLGLSPNLLEEIRTKNPD